MIKKIFLGLFATIVITLFTAFPATAVTECIEQPPNPGKCSSLLPESWCQGNGITEILNLILNIMTAGIGVLATIGLVISGIQWLTARDNEAQVVKAKSRIFNCVVGLVVWALMWLVLSWLLPGGINSNIPEYDIPPSEPYVCTPQPDSSDNTSPTENPSNSGQQDPAPTPPASQTTYTIGNPSDASDTIACDPRTIDLGVHYGYESGMPKKYRFCSIPNLKSTTTDGYISVLQSAGRTDLSGKAVLNSRVAGAVYSMVEAAKADGVTLTAGSTYRSVEWQMNSCKFSSAQKQALQNETLAGKQITRRCPDTNNNYKYKAAPGYSPHQSGVAIDFCKSCGANWAGFKWLKTNSTKFGFANYSSEYWHYDTRCSSTRTWGNNKPPYCS